MRNYIKLIKNQQIAANLKNIRNILKVTQKEIEKNLNINQQTLSSWENEINGISIEDINTLMAYYNEKLIAILSDENIENIKKFFGEYDYTYINNCFIQVMEPLKEQVNDIIGTIKLCKTSIHYLSDIIRKTNYIINDDEKINDQIMNPFEVIDEQLFNDLNDEEFQKELEIQTYRELLDDDNNN